MDTTISIRLDSELNDQLSNMAKLTGRAKSDLVREAIKRQLAIDTFKELRKVILPFAESQGLPTDEDIWREVS